MHRYNQSQVIDFDQEKLTAVYFCSYMYTCVLSSRYCNDQFYDRRLESFDLIRFYDRENTFKLFNF